MATNRRHVGKGSLSCGLSKYKDKGKIGRQGWANLSPRSPYNLLCSLLSFESSPKTVNIIFGFDIGVRKKRAV